MKMKLTYNKAFEELSILVDDIEDDKIQLDKLAEKVKKANELIMYCEKKLHKIEDDVDMILKK